MLTKSAWASSKFWAECCCDGRVSDSVNRQAIDLHDDPKPHEGNASHALPVRASRRRLDDDRCDARAAGLQHKLRESGIPSSGDDNAT